MDNDVSKRVIIKKQDRLDYIMDNSALFFNITRDQLKARVKAEEGRHRKKMVMKILSEIADCSHWDISEAFGGNSQSAVWHNISTLNEDMDTEYGKEIKKTYNNLLSYLNL